ncbi:hypothetical protein [Usitatibacter palustris]|uniref:Uncharacterized protein n=1 Tax=Usitatibacter palustris TaxID=2732487 RepID=A0A6M4H8F9_9PROT|nr:hypothetical protein [Usitatibacter palustris]QJR14287.1 hypothetical protein DSM104440_01080 [Usitatibacter palustris]
MRLTETATGIVIDKGPGEGVFLILVGILILGIFFVWRHGDEWLEGDRRPVSVTLGLAVMPFLMFLAALDSFSRSMTLDDDGVVVRVWYGERDRTVWSEVIRSEVALSHRAARRSDYSRAPVVVLYLRTGREIVIGTGALTLQDANRVVTFVKERTRRQP